MWPNSPSKKEEMTWEEKNRLSELQRDYQEYLERNRIELFKKLPREIRDQVIAELNISKLQHNRFDEVFEESHELNSLERKEEKCSGRGYYMGRTYGTEINYEYKFRGIWENIDEEILMKAYLESEIEDTLRE